VLGEQRLGRRSPDAGLDRGRAGHVVNGKQPVQPAEVHCDDRGESLPARRESADNGRTTRIRNHRDVVLGAGCQQSLYVVVRPGVDDSVRHV